MTTTNHRFYGNGLPHVDPSTLKGKLIVLEGPDSSGRSTQVRLLSDWLEHEGHPVVQTGIKRSSLVGGALEEVMQGHTLNPITFYLYYATDFADQLENVIIPALRSGFVVLADRYIYTLMARDIVRGADPEWLRKVYSFALVPDAVFNLSVNPSLLAERRLRQYSSLDYWELGMDITTRSGDMYQCFIWYQRQVRRVFGTFKRHYGLVNIDGERPPEEVFEDLRARVSKLFTDKQPREVSHDAAATATRD